MTRSVGDWWDRYDNWSARYDPRPWLFAIFAFAMLGLSVVNALNLGQPSYWGTFTASEERECSPAKFGESCSSFGRFVSDDGAIVKERIQLDGPVLKKGETARARYQTGVLNGDDKHNIVHAGTWAYADLWFPWVLALGAGALAWFSGPPMLPRWLRRGS